MHAPYRTPVRYGRLSDATAMENLSLTAFPRSISFPFSNVHAAAAADITCLQCSTFHMCAVFGLDALHVSGFLFLSTFGLVRRSDSCLSLSLSLFRRESGSNLKLTELQLSPPLLRLYSFSSSSRRVVGRIQEEQCCRA